MDSGLIKLNDIVILLNKEDYIGGAFFPRIFRRAGDIVQKMGAYAKFRGWATQKS